jgi:hypothetical protein
MNILDEVLGQLMKSVNQKLSEIIEPIVKHKPKEQDKTKNKCTKCKYNRKYARLYEKKYKTMRTKCYCLLEKKIEQIRVLESENAALRNIEDKKKDKSVFINEISILCRDIMFD